MGAGPSIEKALKAMSDEELTAVVQQAYQADPNRMEKILAVAKLRHFRSTENGTAATLQIEASAAVVAGSFVDLATISPAEADGSTLGGMPSGSSIIVSGSAPLDAPAGSVGSDRMAALWTFSGHTLRELRGGNPSKKRSAPTNTDATEESSPVGGARDDDGYPVLYGSCGREKKYARCSVCYFRGVRCNTAHYCACCQRPVCIRPRTYPGEEHPKICWNVLHMDKDMIQRAEKRRARKIHMAPHVSEKAGDSEAEDAVFQTEPESKPTSGDSSSADAQAPSAEDESTEEVIASREAKLRQIVDSSSELAAGLQASLSAQAPRPKPDSMEASEPTTTHDVLAPPQPEVPSEDHPPIATELPPLAEPSPDMML